MSYSPRQFSFLDQLITQSDRVLRTLCPNSHTSARPSPAATEQAQALSQKEKKHAAGLMRVNHTGEVCAQALYQGQALTAKLPDVRQEMEQAADEELDHLAWCEERVKELGEGTSIFNPLWYGASFAIGAGAGLISDKVSLGFVAATEERVCNHLENHKKQLPESDIKSLAIVEQMLADEKKHGHAALSAGGHDFPKPVKNAMSSVAKIMTTLSYRF